MLTCAKCGSKKDVVAHHKDSNWKNNTRKNLIWLCKPCHKQWHAGKWSYEDFDLQNTCFTEEQFETYVNDTRVHFSQDNVDGLKKWAEAERKRMKNPLIRDMITWKSLANKIVSEQLKVHGHYVGKKREAAHG
jgi:hypothetical protein